MVALVCDSKKKAVDPEMEKQMSGTQMFAGLQMNKLKHRELK